MSSQSTPTTQTAMKSSTMESLPYDIHWQIFLDFMDSPAPQDLKSFLTTYPSIKAEFISKGPKEIVCRLRTLVVELQALHNSLTTTSDIYATNEQIRELTDKLKMWSPYVWLLSGLYGSPTEEEIRAIREGTTGELKRYLSLGARSFPGPWDYDPGFNGGD